MAVNRYYSSNAVDTTLTTGIDASATEIVLASTSGMPQSYPFTLALDYDTASEELVNVVGVGSLANSYKVGSTVGVASITGRGVDGNSATSHSAGAPVKHVISARDIREAQVHINASTKYTVTNGAVTYDVSLHGIADGEGSVVGTAKTQTLTNKSISGASNTITSIAQSSVTNLTSDLALKAPLAGPTFTGTVTLPTGTVSSAMIADGAIVNADINASAAIDWTKLAISSSVSATEIGYVDGVTSAIQTQLDAITSSISGLSVIPVGSVTAYAGNTVPPTGWLLCDGSAVSRTTYSGLFAQVSTTYGSGDGSSTFNLPNLKGRVPVGKDSSQTEFDTLAETGGAKTVSLTEAQMPPHIHSINPSMIVGGGHVATPNTGTAYSPVGDSPSANVTITSAGGTGGTVEAHNNLQPYLVLNYIIKH